MYLYGTVFSLMIIKQCGFTRTPCQSRWMITGARCAGAKEAQETFQGIVVKHQHLKGCLTHCPERVKAASLALTRA